MMGLALCANDDKQLWSYSSIEKSIRGLQQSSVAFDKYSSSNVNLYGFHGGGNQQWLIVE
ncbi:MAG: hypothetical protein HRU20_20815 [Pseudomonadales bacterium]|nr:hypothetical protein [Pseudomonadales bacterium]